METTLTLRHNNFKKLRRNKRAFCSVCTQPQSNKEDFRILTHHNDPMSVETILTTHPTWKRYADNPKFEQIFESDSTGVLNIQLANSIISVTSNYLKRLHISLDTHKGNIMDKKSKSRYLSIMAAFAPLSIKSCFASYSKINKFVKSRLHIDSRIVLNTTFFEERESDIIAFSIEYDGEIMLVGSGNAVEVAERFGNLINSFKEDALSSRDNS